jgi:hypothetical protein
MTMDEKYNCTERARINDHEAVRGLFEYPPKVVSGRYSDRLLVQNVPHWVSRNPVKPHLVVEMGAGRLAGHPDLCDLVTPTDPLPHLDVRLTEVAET